MMLNNKGQGAGAVGSWVYAFATLFMIIVVYVLVSPAYNMIESTMINMTNDSDALVTYGILHMAWNAWPIVLVLGVVIFVIINSARKEPYENYQ